MRDRQYLLKANGALPSTNKVNITKTANSGEYKVGISVASATFTNGSYPTGGDVRTAQTIPNTGIKPGWYKSKGKYRFMKAFGNDAKAEWVHDAGKWYYIEADGYMVTGWKEIKEKWYYLEPSGEMVLGWKKIKGLWYYFKEESEAGYMVTGWREIKGTWYYFKKETEATNGSDYGYMYSHRWLKYKGSWYYFNRNGEMETDKLITWNGKKYYLKLDGIMAINETIIYSKTGKKYKADDTGVCREIINGIITIALKYAKNFVKIVDGSDAYYGGDQAWYDWGDDSKNRIARNGGCGTVAAANIVAYLACNNKKFKGLYSYSDYGQANYLLHMEDIYQYVTPRSIGSNPLGVWPISMLKNGVERFASDRNIVLNAGPERKEIYIRDAAIKCIQEGLEKDSPVALLIGTKGVKNVTITNFDGSSWSQDISLHWVTVTEMKIDENTDTVTVKVSTWGGWTEIDLDKCLEEPIYMGMIYFE